MIIIRQKNGVNCYMVNTGSIKVKRERGTATTPYVGCEPESRMLPTPREFCRHILSERTTQAASNKRRLHPVSGGISL